jgi:peptide/nickel transport system substrate-binding protein
VHFSKIVITVVANPASRLQALQAKQVDAIEGTSDLVGSSRSSGLQVATSAATSGPLIFLDAKHGANPELNDVRVRQAICYAIDRKAVAQALTGGYGQPTSAQVLTDANSAQFTNYYTYNPSKARALLAAAGYPKGFTLHLVSAIDGTLAQAVGKYLDAVGIHPDIQVDPTISQYVDDVFNWKFGGFFGTSTTFSTAVYYSIALNPTSSLALHPLDGPSIKLYYTGLRAKDPSVAWTKLLQRVTSQAWFVYLYSVPNFVITSKSVNGVSVRGPSTPGAPKIAAPIDWNVS